MPTWSVTTSQNGSTIVVAFDGRVSAADGVMSAKAFVDALQRGPADVVWDIRRMASYETAARVAWQHALWPLRHNIRTVEVIGGNPWVRLGALTLTGLLAISVRASDGRR